jgi:hypothetical protein
LFVDDKELQKLRDLFASADAKRAPSRLRTVVSGVARVGGYLRKKVTAVRLSSKASKKGAA